MLLAAANAIIVAAVSWLAMKFRQREAKHEEDSRQRKEEYNALKEGMKAILSDRITQSTEYFTTIGGITAQQMRSIDSLYQSYHNLGGDATITALYKKAMALPNITEHDFHMRSRGCIGNNNLD